jgi:hypothetical protein
VDPFAVEVGNSGVATAVFAVGDALSDALVRPGRVVMRLVVGQDGTQVALAEDQHAVGELCAPASWCGADGGERHQRFARVEPGHLQRGDVAVAALLAEHGDGVPQHQVRLAGPGQVGAGSGEATAHAAGAWAPAMCGPKLQQAEAASRGPAAPSGASRHAK